MREATDTSEPLQGPMSTHRASSLSVLPVQRPANPPRPTAAQPDSASSPARCPPCQGETQNLFQQDRLKSWIQLLANILQQEGLPKGNGIFQSGEEVSVVQSGHLQAVHFLLKGSRGGQGTRSVLPTFTLSSGVWYTGTPLTGVPGAAEIIYFLAQLLFGYFGKLSSHHQALVTAQGGSRKGENGEKLLQRAMLLPNPAQVSQLVCLHSENRWVEKIPGGPKQEQLLEPSA